MKPILQNKFSITLLIILLIIFLHYTSILSPLEKLISFILSPFQTITYSVTTSVSNKLGQITTKQDFNLENIELKQKIDKLEQQIVDLKMFIEENGMIIEQNEYLKSKDFNFVNAKIIAQSVNSNPNLLTINKGEDDKIKKGMAVITENGKVIGKIVNTKAKQSLLLLLTDNQCLISASLAGHSEIIGLTEGKHNISVNLINILKNAPLKKGDLIVTSGQDEHIPSGLLIGEVDEIIDNQSELFKSVNLINQINFKNLKAVSVILN